MKKYIYEQGEGEKRVRGIETDIRIDKSDKDIDLDKALLRLPAGEEKKKFSFFLILNRGTDRIREERENEITINLVNEG